MKKKKSKLQSLLTSALVLSLVAFAIFSSAPTFAYWRAILSDTSDKSYEIEIGEWDPDRKITVKPNGSDSFEEFFFRVPYNQTVGLTRYNEHFGTDPAVKNHSGVDASAYTFDDWYIADTGTTITEDTLITTDLDIYPSWDSTLFTYAASGSFYNVAKNSAAPAYTDPTKDLYVPGWRYKGRKINNFTEKTMDNSIVKDLYIGDGFNNILGNSNINLGSAFLNVTGNSLYIGEGVVEIKEYAFRNSKFSGNLKLPSTVVSVANNAFNGFGFTGTLDLSDTHALETIGINSFRSNQFIGGLDFQESLRSVGQGAFTVGGFTGDIDLSKAVNLESLGSNAFSNTGLTGTVKIGPKLAVLTGFSFTKTPITTLDLSDADSLVSIGTVVFQNSKTLENIIFPKNSILTSIDNQAFQNNKLSGQLVFPSSLTTIKGVVFAGNKLTEVFIPLSVTSMGGTGNFDSSVIIKYEGSAIPSGWEVGWLSKSVIFNATP